MQHFRADWPTTEHGSLSFTLTINRRRRHIDRHARRDHAARSARITAHAHQTSPTTISIMSLPTASNRVNLIGLICASVLRQRRNHSRRPAPCDATHRPARDQGRENGQSPTRSPPAQTSPPLSWLSPPATRSERVGPDCAQAGLARPLGRENFEVLAIRHLFAHRSLPRTNHPADSQIS